TFLAAENGVTQAGDDPDQEAFLSGRIQDLQARLNVTNLIVSNKLDDVSLAAWERLFKHLNLPDTELQALTDGLLRVNQASPAPGQQPRSDQANPLQPESVTDLRWFGLSDSTLHQLAPFITLLPVRTTVNLNTAPPEVLLASVPDLDLAQARALVQALTSHHMTTEADFVQRVNNPALHFNPAVHSFSSAFFSVTGQLRLGSSTVQEVSLLQRDGLTVKALGRSREMVSGDLATLQ
ncbi:MAG: type II secretion system minor pseudopilin GspK, partial [Rhodoferax sp.]|nr:type II secretion system minor pseudopilin GspK [Rhodoferax sp.]